MKNSYSLNSNAYSYHNDNIAHIDSILSPLRKYFSIDSFMYMEFFNDDRTFFLSNEKEVIRRILMFEKFSDAFYTGMEKSPLDIYQVFIWPPNSMDHINLLFKEFNINNGFTVMRKTSESIKAYAFISKKADLNLGEWYANNSKIVFHFINHFNYKAHAILAKKQKYLAKFKTPKIYMPNDGSDTDEQIANSFLKETEIKRFYLSQKQDVYLTKREKECLNLILKGECYKEAARKLGMSFRTFESHVTAIKCKINLHSKSRIINFFEQEKDIFIM